MNKFDNILEKAVLAFKSKRFKYGTFSAVTAIVVIALLVAANLAVERLNVKFDITPEKLYTLSDRTKTVIKSLETDITIYALFPTGNEVPTYSEILDQFPANSSRITVERRDPILYPAFFAQYETEGVVIETYSLIVVGPKRHKIIQASEFTGTGLSEEQTIDIEPKIVNAIQYVQTEETEKVYAITGHGEYELPSSYIAALTDANYEYATLDMMTQDIPEDCSALLLISPQRDYSLEETARLREYLKNNGRMMMFFDAGTGNFPNLFELTKEYGFSFGDAYVIEQDTANYFQNYTAVLPNMSAHSTTAEIINRGYRVMLVANRPILLEDYVSNTTTVTPLFTTSASAYGKVNPDSSNMGKEDGDLDGPFNIGIAVTDVYFSGNTDFETRIMAVGTSSLLADTINQYVYGSNMNFFVQSIMWLAPHSEDFTYISPKSLEGTDYLDMTAQDALTFKIVSTAVIPSAILGTGLVIWIRRRNR